MPLFCEAGSCQQGQWYVSLGSCKPLIHLLILFIYILSLYSWNCNLAMGGTRTSRWEPRRLWKLSARAVVCFPWEQQVTIHLFILFIYIVSIQLELQFGRGWYADLEVGTQKALEAVSKSSAVSGFINYTREKECICLAQPPTPSVQDTPERFINTPN